MPKIDIIIPVYNQADKISPCLMSIFKQTFKDFSVIVVNDGSTDKINNVLEKYKKNIKVINQSNQGANAARNRGAKEARSEYILFCDADIILKPKMLERMHNILKQNKRAAYAYSS